MIYVLRETGGGARTLTTVNVPTLVFRLVFAKSQGVAGFLLRWSEKSCWTTPPTRLKLLFKLLAAPESLHVWET